VLQVWFLPYSPNSTEIAGIQHCAFVEGELVSPLLALLIEVRRSVFWEVQLKDAERFSVRRVMSSSCSHPSPVKE
jgi:hypothetical protein